jgi:hypothetical protein
MTAFWTFIAILGITTIYLTVDGIVHPAPPKTEEELKREEEWEEYFHRWSWE